MQIRLQTLDHQQRALSALTHVFENVRLDYSSPMEANPVFDVACPQIIDNIAELQAGMVEGVGAIPRP